MNKAALITVIAMLTFGAIIAVVKKNEMKQERKERIENIWNEYEISMKHIESCYRLEKLDAEYKLLKGCSEAEYDKDLDKAFNKWDSLNVYYQNKLEEDLNKK